MKKEIQIILTADEGKHLTDGECFCTEIRLPENANEKVWREITEEEYQQTLEEQKEEE